MNNKAAFIELQDVIKGILRDTWESNTSLYQRYMSWGKDCINHELNLDAFQNIIGRFIHIDSATKIGLLPDDFVKQTKVGLQTANKEFVPLVPNNSLIIDPIIDACDTVDEHCDCGCNDEVCYAMGESNVVTTFSDVVINGTTYQNSVTVCAQDSGDVIKKTCNWSVVNPKPECTYVITVTLSASALINDPFSNVVIIKNGLNEFIGDVEDVAALTTLMSSLGFSVFSSGVTSIVYIIEGSTDVWANFSYIDSIGGAQSIQFFQTQCITPGVPYESCDYNSGIIRNSLFPLTNVSFLKNGSVIFIGDIANLAAQDALFVSLGWTVGANNYAIASSDVWASITFTDSTDETITSPFVPGNCSIITPSSEDVEVEQYCYEEKVCEVEVKPCGCIVVADTDIEVICACCNFACAVTERRRKNKDFGQTFAQPKGYFGEYKIDVNKGVLKVNTEYQYDTVYIEYYSSNVVDSKTYLVPVQAKEPIMAWIYWKSLQRKRGVPRWEKKDAKDDYYNEKRKMKQRLNPLNLDDFMSVKRVFQRP